MKLRCSRCMFIAHSESEMVLHTVKQHDKQPMPPKTENVAVHVSGFEVKLSPTKEGTSNE